MSPVLVLPQLLNGPPRVAWPFWRQLLSTSLLSTPQDLSAQLQLLREEQLSVKEGDSSSGGDTAKLREEVESLRSLLSERCKELEEAVSRGDRRAVELAQAQEAIKVCACKCRVVCEDKFTEPLSRHAGKECGVISLN